MLLTGAEFESGGKKSPAQLMLSWQFTSAADAVTSKQESKQTGRSELLIKFERFLNSKNGENSTLGRFEL